MNCSVNCPNATFKSENDIHGGSKLMVTVIIVFLLKYSVEILVGNKKVGKNFGRYQKSR